MMKIGIPKEIKNAEDRVAMTAAGVKKLVQAGHTVVVEKNAGLNSGFTNEDYAAAGASLGTATEAWHVDMVVKVKEPQKSEYPYLKNQIVFTFFHLAGVDKSLTLELVKKGTTALAYESLEDENGRLPILEPMSAVAGNMSVLMGAYHLARFNQGNGMQLGTILNKSYGKVVIVGDGVVGQHAAKVASAMGAQVVIAGLDEQKWKQSKSHSLPAVRFIQSNQNNIFDQIGDADLVVGAVLCRGARTPKIITEEMLKTMQTGSVIVDVSIDQGGCVETSHPTTHSDPVFIKHGVVHYCVANMPGAYPKASTIALTQVTLGYIQAIADKTLAVFISEIEKRKALNVYKGKIVCEQVARDHDLLDLYQPLSELI